MFKKITGVNFTHYVSRVRIEKAKDLLLNPNLRISEIAYEVGFQSLTKLTDREFEVFQLVGQGKGTKEIAAQLRLSAKTVEVHRLNIKKKLSLQTAAELIRYAVRWVEG